MNTAVSTISPGTAKSTRALRRIGFLDTLRSEWTKLTSLRSTYVTLALGVALALGLTAAVSAAIGGSWETQQAMFANFNPTAWSFDAMLFSTTAFTALGVTAAASEYSSGMIRLTLTATPRRGAVLAAKALVVALVTLAVGFITAVGMFVIAQLIYSSYGMPSAAISDADSVKAIIGAGLMTAVFPVLGVALGFLLRSTAGGISIVLALFFAPALLGSLLPIWWQENVISVLPRHATQNVMLGHMTQGQPTHMEPAAAAVIVAAWLVLALGAAFIALAKRDA
jgi:ABC-2 type transport system permease protein